MAAPVNNPFGAPPSQAFATPQPNPFAKPLFSPATPFGQASFAGNANTSRPSSRGAGFSNPFGSPQASAPLPAATSQRTSPSPQNPFGTAPPPFAAAGAGASAAGAGHLSQLQNSLARPPHFAPSQPSAHAPSFAPPQKHNPFGAPKQPSRSPSPRIQNQFPPSAQFSPFQKAPGFASQPRAQSPQAAHNPFSAGPATETAPVPLPSEAMARRGSRGKNKPFDQHERSQPRNQPGRNQARDQPERNQAQDQPERNQPRASRPGVVESKGPLKEPSQRSKQLSEFAFNYANKIIGHLRKERLNPPSWPAEPGNPDKRGPIESLKEQYKKYRAKVYESLRKVEYIDDPEKRRKLEDALPFKGICEEMCPEFEQVSRIAEFDVKTEEKAPHGAAMALWAEPSRMVKKFGRSAAGQEAPLPMDVRTFAALRKTTDYLFNDLLQSDANLPSMHNFLWDRTRGVRRDFTFHSQKSPEEMKELVHCFETITRFHASALHLLSRKGFASSDFDQRQEVEQLGRTILSLVEAYDECREKRVTCKNEPEFRAYYLLLNAGDPSIAKRIPAWGKEYWFGSREVQTAFSLIQAMEDVREPKGPIKPRRMTTLADTAFTNYFSIVEDCTVSYTMACIAEVHFTSVRQCILKNLVKAYARPRDAPRTITASDLNKMLRFDTDEEAVEFAKLHSFEFSTWVPEGKDPVPEPYLLLNDRRKYVPSPRVTQAYSYKLVERKRNGQSLPYVIYNTIYDEANETRDDEDSTDDLFVARAPAVDGISSPDTPSGISPPAVPAETPAPKATAPAFPSFQSAAAGLTAFGQGTTPAQAASSASTTPSQPPAPSPAPKATAPAFPSFQSAAAGPSSTPSAFGQAQDISTPISVPPAPGAFSFLKAAPSATPALPPPKIAEEPAPAWPSAPVSEVNGGAPKTTPATIFPGKPSDTVPTKPFGLSDKPASILSSDSGSSSSPSSTGAAASENAAPKKSTSLIPSQSPAVPAVVLTPPSEPLPSLFQGSVLPPTPKINSSAVAGPVFPTPGFPTTPTQTLPQSKSTPFLPQPAQPAQPTFPAVPAQQTPREADPLGKFTNWFVTGDGGLMEQFIDTTVHDLVADVFEKFRKDEEDRKRKEQDDKSWQEARKFQVYNLRVKYFYRWQRNAREKARARILREGKEKMRAYRAQERVLQQKKKEDAERAEKEAKRAERRKLEAYGYRLSAMASERRSSVAERRQSVEEQLLASGIFSGLRNERAVAQRVAKEAENDGPVSASFRYPASELELVPAKRSSIRGRQPESRESSVSKQDGWKTRSLREKFGLDARRSTSAGRSVNSSVNGSSQFRQSLPAVPKTTNFSRKRLAEESSDDERDPKRKSLGKANGYKSRHWDLRARGLVPMPDGQWLPEAIANAVKDGKRTKSNGAHGLLADPTLDNEDNDSEDRGDGGNATPSSLQLRLARLKIPNIYNDYRHSVGRDSRSSNGPLPSVSPRGRENGGAKRKRGSPGAPDDDEDMRDDEAETGFSSPSSAKKKRVAPAASPLLLQPPPIGTAETNAMVEQTQNMLRELRETMDRLDADRPFLRDQMDLIQGFS
ncbi:SAC3/GANP/Nin1/mts3/eIF-3 p25 family-domain-containing protein [Lasiosphaeria ovina]|uniref:SAC3/GANP/Nin1/mts3/eIF-3 p25 family-domain-containing protein n=1 Tax=Lasiosphaeria ovina TaxID=92902 RepID=A0AAE0KC55_9PEZI|nr:SAC3/GANP/Nin1/mts3/eIF-3 p25 family-domain-containing protein [Lasiosphaeria ovina]